MLCWHVFLQYEGGEPCIICGHVLVVTDKKAGDTVMPTAILPGHLYLGSYDTASRSELLKAMGITHILNVGSYFDLPDLRLFNLRFIHHAQPPYGANADVCTGIHLCHDAHCSALQSTAPNPSTQIKAAAIPEHSSFQSSLNQTLALPYVSADLQTVPNCQALFKNTFQYHTVSEQPPKYEECHAFIGGWLLSSCTPVCMCSALASDQASQPQDSHGYTFFQNPLDRPADVCCGAWIFCHGSIFFFVCRDSAVPRGKNSCLLHERVFQVCVSRMHAPMALHIPHA